MLVSEIWKCIHHRVPYSLRATPEGNMILLGEYTFTFPQPPWYECFIIPNETKKNTCMQHTAGKHILSPLKRCLRHLKKNIAAVA